MKIYTKTGDAGTTSLVGGTRVPKDCPRIEAYGTLDELMSFIGAISASRECPDEIRGQLCAVQSKLFDIGTYLATPPSPQTPSPETSPEAASEAFPEASSEASPEAPASEASPEAPCLNPTLRLESADIARLEQWIDVLSEQLPPLTSFVLPGGTELAARAHQARTVCRRAERAILSLSATPTGHPAPAPASQASAAETPEPLVLQYINRLSDYLFLLARYFNFLIGVSEIPYRP